MKLLTIIHLSKKWQCIIGKLVKNTKRIYENNKKRAEPTRCEQKRSKLDKNNNNNNNYNIQIFWQDNLSVYT